MEVSIIIPTHNRSDALARTLDLLSKQRFEYRWEAIVVNNRSTDDTDEVVRLQRFPVPLRLVHESTPGAAAARNAGARVATGQYLIFLDNDILVEPDFAQRHYDSLREYKGCWILGHVVTLSVQERTPFGRFRAAHCAPASPSQGIVEVKGLAGANVSMPRADFERLGGFDETFRGASVEDLELAIRAWQAGIKVMFNPGIVGVHNDWAGSSIRDYCLRQRLYSRSEPLLWSKYGAAHPRLRLVNENLPPRWDQDPPSLILRKMVKIVVGTHPVQEALFGICSALERLWPAPRPLWRFYKVLLSAAIYRGFQEGLALHGISREGSKLGYASRRSPIA
ncbi:MAG TPA: glycosyltransferase [Blastocatellia bacterium]|nr:glycosyltransferase [Blastocatellia bacterium]